MGVIEKRTISLPAEQAGFIDAQVASGQYASASEVVRAGLRALQERDGFASPASRGGATDPGLGERCAAQARIIRDAEGDAAAADDEAWFESSDGTGWTV